MTETQLARREESAVDVVTVDPGKILQYLGLRSDDPAAQAAVAICKRYGLDPVLRHVVLIEESRKDDDGNWKKEGRPYITRDGLLHVAHESGELDGIVLVQDPVLNDERTHWVARVEVYRKDMSHPFSLPGRYPAMRTKWRGQGDNRQRVEEPHPHGPEMAIKCSEAMTLRRAFDVSAPVMEEQWDRPDVVEASEVAHMEEAGGLPPWLVQLVDEHSSQAVLEATGCGFLEVVAQKWSHDVDVLRKTLQEKSAESDTPGHGSPAGDTAPAEPSGAEATADDAPAPQESNGAEQSAPELPAWVTNILTGFSREQMAAAADAVRLAKGKKPLGSFEAIAWHKIVDFDDQLAIAQELKRQASGGAPQEESESASRPEPDGDPVTSPPGTDPQASGQADGSHSSPSDEGPKGEPDPRARLELVKHTVKGKIVTCADPRVSIPEGEICGVCNIDPRDPVFVDHPCPECGSECQPWTSANPRAPKWRCTNPECTGSDDGKPWVSWHVDPWKPGGEIEQMSQEPASDTPPQPTAPASEQATLGGEARTGPPASSPKRSRSRKAKHPT